MEKSTILAGTVSLQSFQKDGIHRHSAPMESYYSLFFKGALAPNQSISFDILASLQLISLLIGSSDNTVSSGKITISIINTEDIITSQFEIPFTDTDPSSGAVASTEFPFMVINPKWRVEVKTTFNTNYIQLWAKQVFLEARILGQRI
jgi:hypothetical protein